MADDLPINRREFEARFDALKQEIAAQKDSITIAMAAADRAITKAETAVEKRFENSNEWRNTVETLQRTYMPRAEFEQVSRTLSDKIATNSEALKARDDRGAGSHQTWLMLGLICSIVANVVLVFIYLSKGHA
jgi:multidrug resistance efflux pump